MTETKATDRQIAYMKSLGISFPKNVTKFEATKLISKTQKPSSYQKAVLKRFGEAATNEWDAREKVEVIFSDTKNVQKWDNRPAKKQDKLLIEFMEGKKFSRLTNKKAEQLIAGYYDDTELEVKADNFIDELDRLEDEKEERSDTIQEILEAINDEPSYYGLTRVSKKQVSATIEIVEANLGKKIVDLWDNPSIDETEIVAKELLLQFPEKVRKVTVKTKTRETEKLQNTGCSIFLVTGLLLFSLIGGSLINFA